MIDCRRQDAEGNSGQAKGSKYDAAQAEGRRQNAARAEGNDQPLADR